MKNLLITAAALLALTGCDAASDLVDQNSKAREQLDRKIGRTLVRDTTNNELDDWSDRRIDDAAEDICELIRDGKAMSADKVYLALRDDELRGVSPRAGTALFTYAQRYEC